MLNLSELFNAATLPQETDELQIVATDDFHIGSTALAWENCGDLYNVRFCFAASGQNSEFFEATENVVIAATRQSSHPQMLSFAPLNCLFFRIDGAFYTANFEEYVCEPNDERNVWVEGAVCQIPFSTFRALCKSETASVIFSIGIRELDFEPRHFSNLRALQAYISRGALEKARIEGTQNVHLN